MHVILYMLNRSMTRGICKCERSEAYTDQGLEQANHDPRRLFVWISKMISHQQRRIKADLFGDKSESHISQHPST